MNIKQVTQCGAIATLVFLTGIFGVEAFIESGIGYRFATTQHSLFWLFAGIYLSISLVRSYVGSATFLMGMQEGVLLGARLLSWWLTAGILLCILFRLDFSATGLTHTLFFFLWPREVLSVVLPAGLLHMLSGIHLFLGGLLVCAAVAVRSLRSA